jgi:hypothetical protein
MPLLGSRGGGSAKGFGLTAGGAAPVNVDYLVVAGGGSGGVVEVELELEVELEVIEHLFLEELKLH